MVSAADRINRGAHFIEKANGIAEAASRRSRAAVAGIDDRDRDIGIFAACLRCKEGFHVARIERSEEHTSELQSLMRISYAVFCLKKKITKQQQINTRIISHANTNTITSNTHHTHAPTYLRT